MAQPEKKSGIGAFFMGFRWAGEGLFYALKTQRNMQVHLFATLVACMVSGWLKLTALAWAVLFLTFALVWLTELLNTALETTLDLLSPEYHPQVKIAKDLAAAAVLVTALFSILIACCLWGPPLIQLYISKSA